MMLGPGSGHAKTLRRSDDRRGSNNMEIELAYGMKKMKLCFLKDGEEDHVEK